MKTILDDVRHYDTFNLMTFNSAVSLWKTKMLEVTDSTITEAKTFINNMKAAGGKLILNI